MKDRIKVLRENSTDAEKKLWYFLRGKFLQGFKFRRQHLIYPYIVDFVCLTKKLIIELDGGQHIEQSRYDHKRSLFLKSKGYKVIRFWNHDVLQDTETILNEILNILEEEQ